jgi:hypothetical protein
MQHQCVYALCEYLCVCVFVFVCAECVCVYMCDIVCAYMCIIQRIEVRTLRSSHMTRMLVTLL